MRHYGAARDKRHVQEGKVSFSKDKEPTETKVKTHTLNKERGEERGTEITEAEVRIEGSEKMKRAVKTLLHKYRDCFAKEMNEIGAAKGVQMEIELNGDGPIYVKPRKLPYAQENVVHEIVSELLENDIIEPSVSAYNSPIVLVKKKDGKWRMAIDYRALNQKTVKDRYPPPEIDRCLNTLEGAKVFISLDLYSGYYQVPVAESSRERTAFFTPDGHFHFKRMPFGLVNSGAVFQRAIDKMIKGLKQKNVVAYVDDILIGAKTEQEAIKVLENLL